LDKIKIFHVVESFGGGVFGSVTQLCNHMDKAKFDVCLVYSIRPETPLNYQDYFDRQIKLINIPMGREISPIKDIKSFLSLYKLLKENRPCIVHLHSSKAGFLGRLAAGLLNIKKVYYSPRGFAFLREDVSALKRKLYYFLEKVAAQFSGIIVGCSKDEFAYAKKISSSSVFIPNGVDLTLIERFTTENRKKTSKIIIGTSGRISPQKNPRLFCSLASLLKDERVAFIWIGDGEMSDVLEKSDVSIEKTGWKNREESLALTAVLDIYIQTSLWEGMPISVLEAMALGKPVVATEIVGNRDLVVHEKTGFLAKDEKEFLKFLNILIDNPQERKAMGEAGSKLIRENFDITKLVKQFESLYLI
jgi:hypothetical protein